MNPTPEQLAIFDSDASVMKIKAGAGTGKTTSLEGLAGRHRRDRILYLAFNRAIKEEAQARFPSNVRSMTGHGLAFSQIGRYYADEPGKLLPTDLKPFHVLPSLEKSVREIPTGLHNLYGGRVIETVKSFLVSADPELAPAHISIGASPGEKKHFDPNAILMDARIIWHAMHTFSKPLPITHDGYLKLFQLENPDLGYDLILLDEAQDTNPVIQGLVDTQPSRLAYVGDEHQAIYSFRGARNAMALLEAEEDHFLTGSFRFGPEVAAIANNILAAKGEQSLRLRGLGASTQVGRVDPKLQQAYISRGNSALFYRAVQALKENQSFAFVGAMSQYRMDLIEQTYRLSVGQPTTDPFLKAFLTFDDLQDYGEAMEDGDIISRCKLVTKYGDRLPRLLQSIQSNAKRYPDDRTQLVLTTAHRSKGLEFDHVVLADDYMDFYDEKQGQWRDLTDASQDTTEQVNLYYVAATRAKKGLETCEKLDRFLAHVSKDPNDAPEAPRESTPLLPVIVKRAVAPRPVRAPSSPQGRPRPFSPPQPKQLGRPTKLLVNARPSA